MLEINKLEHIRHSGEKLIAACPACREAGHDKQGNHLIVYRGDDGTHESGRFGCVANEGDSVHRSAIFSFIGVKEEPSDMEKVEWAERARKAAQKTRQRKIQELEAQRITQELERTLEARLAPYQVRSWRIDLLDHSPINFDCPDAIRHDFIKSLYLPEDILWMGDVYDSGSEEHRQNFRTCEEWLELATLPPRIAPSTFLAGSFSRSSTNVKTSPFIVIESDELIGYKPETLEDKERNKALSNALTGYAQDQLGLTLRAVIDTGNKSLHSWFDRPPPRALDAIKKMASGLRIDDGPIDQGHFPLRMPGCIHDTAKQNARLLYLHPIHK